MRGPGSDYDMCGSSNGKNLATKITGMVASVTVTVSETVKEKTKPLYFSWMNPAPEWT
jgi:hypothetical protein